MSVNRGMIMWANPRPVPPWIFRMARRWVLARRGCHNHASCVRAGSGRPGCRGQSARPTVERARELRNGHCTVQRIVSVV